VDAPEVGDAFEPLNFTISAEDYEDTADILSETQIIDAKTHPTGLSKAGEGYYYPVVFGNPGEGRPATYAFPYNSDSHNPQRANKVVVSARPVIETAVNLYQDDRQNERELPGSPYTIQSELDALGQRLYFVDITTETTDDREHGVFFVSWDNGGAKSSTTTGGVDTVGKLVAELAYLSDVPVDMPALRSAVESMPGKVGWFIDEPTKPMDALADVLEALPVSLYSSENGLAAVRVDLDRAAKFARPLVEGLNAWRQGPVRNVKRAEDAAGTIVVEYAPDRIRDKETRRVRVSVNPDPATLANASVWSRTSSTPDTVQNFRLPWTYSASTAMFVATWLGKRQTISERVMSVELEARLAWSLPMGAHIKFTDPALGMDGVVGMVTAKTYTDEPMWLVELAFYSDTSQMGRATPAEANPNAPTVAPA